VTTQTTSLLERVLFGLTRTIGVLAALASIAGIALCVMYLAGDPAKRTYVSLEEALSTKSVSDSDEDSGAQRRDAEQPLPPNVAKYTSGDNRKILDGWLRPLTKERRADFLNNLDELIAKAEAEKKNVVDVINGFKELKLKKFSQSEFDDYAVAAKRATAGAAILGLTILLMLASLMLVALAIERHTRSALTLPPTLTTGE
jgi:hypothetical protein